MLAAGKGLSDPPGLNALPTPTILRLAWAPLPDQQAMGAQERTRGSPEHTKPPMGVHRVKDKIISTSCYLLTNFLLCAKLHARHFVRLAPYDCPWGQCYLPILEMRKFRVQSSCPVLGFPGGTSGKVPASRFRR